MVGLIVPIVSLSRTVTVIAVRASPFEPPRERRSQKAPAAVKAANFFIAPRRERCAIAKSSHQESSGCPLGIIYISNTKNVDEGPGTRSHKNQWRKVALVVALVPKRCLGTRKGFIRVAYAA